MDLLDIKYLLRLNMELEGALRIVAERATPDTLDYLADKYRAFDSAMKDCFDFQTAVANGTEPVVETPSVDIPIIEEPAVEETVVEEPVVEEPVVEEPVVEETVIEEPVIEEPVIEDPVVETPVIEQTVVEEPVVETPVVEDTVVEEPIVEAPVVDQPEVDAPVVESPVVDEPTVDEPVVVQPVVEVATESTPQQPTVNERMQSDRRVSDMIAERNARDLARAFTVNEKIGFIRGLFCEDRSDFEYTVAQIASLDSLDEAYDYLLNDLGWDIENDEVKAFLTIVTNHFNAN